MHQTHIRTDIQRALNNFTDGEIHKNATYLLKVLGYQSQRTLNRDTNTIEAFREDFDPDNLINPQKAHLHDWQTADFLFQLTADEIRQHMQEPLTFYEDPGVDESIYQSYLFLAIKLKGWTYSRPVLANITREINNLYAIPAMLIFQHGHALTFAIINRRPSQRDRALDVLEKVTLIKDIDVVNPHRAHLDILAYLSLDALYHRYEFSNFLELHQAWQQTLDTSELNRRFFKEIADWYFWAVEKVTFPADAGDDETLRNATGVIRLITRLIFVWFLKEKNLVPNALFDEEAVAELLTSIDLQESTYYKAILQNLFFATLNQEMNTPEKPNTRKFRGEGRQHYNITSLYRYKRHFKDPDVVLRLFETIPFLNGGLFECLDKPDPDDAKTILRVDGFSDREDNPLSVPNELFFSEPQAVNLNAVYDTKNSRYTVRGFIHILNRYKFTIAENTPIEHEVALDPELLGQVFENLLAAYNPETGTTARKQTGSFYTPREVVNYMVDESLIAYLKNTLDASGSPCIAKLRHLLSYTEEPHQFTDTEVEHLITAIDTLKILDPACGSGAFPMGVLHKLVFLLSKLDPRNAQWRQRQINRVQNTITEAAKIDDSVIRENTIEELEREIENINEAFERNELDYGRKLYLIENCIYGVDIQPIATQIAKLRFFISLIVEQRIDDTHGNRGVRPLPNLETKFVAANTLLDVEKPAQMSLRNPEIDTKEQALEEVRRRHFTARTPRTKDLYRHRDTELRAEMSALLKRDGFPNETTERIAGWDPYDQNATADFFDPEWMFGITEGFDITIGNPPYVRADAPGQQVLRQQIKGSNLYETLYDKWDLYIPFIERSYKLLKPDGFTTLIVSDAYCHAKYAQKSQNWFLKNSKVLRLDFLGKIQVFDAAVRNIVYLFQRVDGNNNEPERRVHAEKFGEVHFLSTDKQCNLTHRAFFPEDTRAQQFSSPTVALSEICYISYGLRPSSKKGAKEKFVTADLVSEDRDELHCKPFVEGKHLDVWLPPTHLWLEWGTERAPSKFYAPTFPEMYEINEKILVQRSPGPDPKACYDNQYLIFTPSSVGFILWHSLSGVRNESIRKQTRYRDETPQRPDLPQRDELEGTSRRFAVKFLLGIMNSTFARDFLRANRRSNIHLYPDNWKKLPIPDVLPAQQKPIVALVDEILAAKRADFETDVDALETALDREVAVLYGITAK